MSVRTAVVLAAGEGTRLHPLTHNRPKPMLPAANRPVLEYVLDALVEAGIERVCLVVGYKCDRVQEHFGPRYRDCPITYVHQKKQLGSGHALLQARESVEGPPLVVNGDRVIEPSLVSDVVRAFERDAGPAVLGVIERPNARQYGAVVLQGGRIEQIVEKPDSDEYRLINAGVYAFDSSVFDAIAATPRREGELQLPDTIAELIDEGDVQGIRTEGLWADATYPWDILTVTQELLARGRVDEPEREAESRIWINDSARVHDDAALQAPVVVGADCEVGPGAVVGPTTALGHNVTVGSNATIERCVLDADTRVGAGSVLLDCVTGQDVDLGPATVGSGGPADVRIGSSVFENRRLGAVVADRVHAVGDTGLAPGTLVGPNATLHHGARASGRIAAGAEVVR
jgi:glucose-1-phosphate thymidylyltransferase